MKDVVVNKKVSIGRTPEDKKNWYKKEVDRVREALDAAYKKRKDLEQIKIRTLEQHNKIIELTAAIKIGSLYLAKVKAQCE